MKIKTEHYEYIKQGISGLDIEKVKAHRKMVESDEYHQPQNIDKRIRWDCFRAARLTTWCCDNLYTYLNDDHIDTALRSIAIELGI